MYLVLALALSVLFLEHLARCAKLFYKIKGTFSAFLPNIFSTRLLFSFVLFPFIFLILFPLFPPIVVFPSFSQCSYKAYDVCVLCFVTSFGSKCAKSLGGVATLFAVGSATAAGQLHCEA